MSKYQSKLSELLREDFKILPGDCRSLIPPKPGHKVYTSGVGNIFICVMAQLVEINSL